MVKRDAFFIRTPFFGLCPVYFFKTLPLNLEAILLPPHHCINLLQNLFLDVEHLLPVQQIHPPPAGPLRRSVPTLNRQCWGLSAKVWSPEKTTEMLQAALRRSCWDAR